MTDAQLTPRRISARSRSARAGIRPKNGTVNFVLEGGMASGKDLLVGTNPLSGKITTVIRGWDLVTRRMVPIAPPPGPPILLGPGGL